MKKTVLCEFGGRCRKVLFETQPGHFDVSCLKNALIKASESDQDLRDKINNNNLIIQHVKPELCPQPIDIDDDNIIEDKSIVTVVFTPNNITILDMPVIQLRDTLTEKEISSVCDNSIVNNITLNDAKEETSAESLDILAESDAQFGEEITEEVSESTQKTQSEQSKVTVNKVCE